ncbi:polyamine deacetylase HDAC10 isoform X3 [Nerophis ophidion]|uniref:polyamine deacetylase HDAC10 isoform X3 n=1 Tax=Nerophis ophidion TaxID=159077 RepID=UPI002ADF3271|nr:polyamine deacetylase HDAC10 isoform X3 [Nerophis ophidion]
MGTALVFDEEMTRYKLLWFDPACVIETPERLTVSHEALVRTGLAARCVPTPVREASDDDILLVHSKEYLEAVKKTPYMTLDDLKEFTLNYGDVYFHPNIYHCAKLAVGAALQLVDAVMTGKVRNGMALVRPPGHHSMRSAASGFCVFNNVAIAAKYAQQKYAVQRVLIVDWDIHHGQGVQYAFEDDPSVLYFSWHRYEHQEFWPKLRDSDYDCVGKDKGAGFTINVPWNKIGMQNSDYLAVFCHVLLPVAYEFCPDLVLVCAGFDSAIGDPEGEMCATPDIFAHLTHLLMNLAGGKLCAVLEIRNGLALVSDVSMAMAHVFGHTPKQRVLAVCVGDTEALPGLPEDGKTLTVHFSKEALDKPRCKYYIPVCLKKGLMQAACSLLLPLSYQYDPDLVLLTRVPGSHMDQSEWQQLVGLLQGLAGGHVLVLIQEGEKALVGPTASSLSGSPASSPGPLSAPGAEDIEALERLKYRLTTDWKLLQTSGEC